MGKYAAYGQVAAAAVKPLVVLGSDGTVHPEIIRIDCGISSSPADNMFVVSVKENTDMGTGGTAITPKKVGHAATAGTTSKKGTFTADPTVTGNQLLVAPVYARSPRCIFNALPGEGLTSETLAANRGLGLWCEVAPAGSNIETTVTWIE